MSENSKASAIILLGVLSLIWGTSFILIKQGLKVFSADEVGAIRVSAASLFLVPFAVSRLKQLSSKHYGKLFLSGLMGVFFPAFLFAAAQTHMNSSLAGILNTLTPIFTMLIGVIFFSLRFKAIAIVGLLLGVGGTFMLILSRSEGGIVGINLYALLVMVACVLYGSNLNFIKFKIADLGSMTITSVSLMLIGPLAIVYLLTVTDFTYKLGSLDGAWRAFGFVVLLGMMSTSLATYLFNQLVKISTPLFASSVTYLIPIVAVMWGLADGEHLYLGHYVGMAAIVLGVYLANRK